MLRVVDTRQLDEDAIRAFTLDRRLLGSRLVYAPADDLDRLVDSLPAPGLGSHGAETHLSRPVRGNIDRQIRIDLAQGLTRCVDADGLADREHDRIAFDVEPGISDIRIAQRVAHIVDDRVEPVALRGGNV